MSKETKIISKTKIKSTIQNKTNTDTEKSIWRYDMIDRNGKFAFEVSRPDFNHKDYLEKMINYSSMTWAEIKKQTHDKGKSKNHFLPFEKISKEARIRFYELQLNEFEDAIFSFALNNLTRIIGIRQNQFFFVLWYDVNHEVYPTLK